MQGSGLQDGLIDGTKVVFRKATKMMNTARPLQDQVAVVTGAGQGIGAGIARKLASLGALTVLCGRTPGTLNETANLIRGAGNRAEVAECDVTSLASVEAVAVKITSQYRRVDILVNNAGVGSFATPLHELAPSEWDRLLDTNLRGVFYTIRSFAPVMIRSRSGHIINVSSIAGKNALPNGAAYAASKWGLNGLSYSVASVAEELRAHNIRVAVICPGSTHTDLSPHEGKNTSRMLQPDDIAHVVEMLVTQSPQSFASEIVIRPTLKP
jgi:3-oxoacyl-[acyl-carrier protein] reductase